MTYTHILTETRGRVGLLTLNRPQALNALNHALLTELMDALTAGVHFPPNAVAICISAWTTVALAGGTITTFNRDLQLRNASESELYSAIQVYGTAASPAGGSFTDAFEGWLQVPPSLPSGAPAAFHVLVQYLNSGTYSAQKIFVKGWQLA